METTEIVAELRKQGLWEAADRLESLDKRWKRTVVERDQARQMRERAERLLAEKTSGDLISRQAVLAALSSRLSIVDMVGVAEVVGSVPAVEAEPVVHAHWVPAEGCSDGVHALTISECSHCGCGVSHHGYSCPDKRCKQCGAHMDEEVVE